jgi:hypothetical protein
VTLEQAVRFRKRLGQVGALIFILFFASLLDSCVARFREPLFTVHLLPGGSELVDGPVDHDLKEPSQLRVEATSESVRLRIDRFQSSFWLGGNMWVGEISAGPDAPAGAYDFRVFARRPSAQPPVAAFRAVVYPDDAALRESYLSLIRRTFDVHPGMVSLACIAALGFVMGMMFLLGRRVERLLADQGQAEIFMVKTAAGGFEVWFGLGRRHGVERPADWPCRCAARGNGEQHGAGRRPFRTVAEGCDRCPAGSPHQKEIGRYPMEYVVIAAVLLGSVLIGLQIGARIRKKRKP